MLSRGTLLAKEVLMNEPFTNSPARSALKPDVNTNTAFAFDYEKQYWIGGHQGCALRIKQLTEELSLLKGDKGAQYAKFTGVNQAEAIRVAERDLNHLSTNWSR